MCASFLPGARVFEAPDWDPEPGAFQYHVDVGATPSVGLLADPADDSCRAAIVTGESDAVPADLVPPPGELYCFVVRPEALYGVGEVAEGSLGSRLHDSTGDCGTSCAVERCST